MQLKTSPPGPTEAFLESWRPHAWICAVVAAVYAQALFFGVTLLDDNIFVGAKLSFLSDWANLPSLFTQGSFLGGGGVEMFYRPLLMLSTMVDAHLFGGSIQGWHLLNITFHAMSSLLVFTLFRKAGYRDRSLLLALVFAVHPALAQAVGWVPGRTESFLALFVLASFNFFLDYLAGGRASSAVLHLLCLGLALLSKELAVVVPFVCAAYAVLMGPSPAPRRRLWAVAVGWLALLAGWHLVRAAVLPSIEAYTPGAIARSVWVNLPALWLYLWKAVLPLGLSTYPILADASRSQGVEAVILCALALALAVTKGTNPRAVAMGAAWFLAFLLPSLVYPKSSIEPVFFEYRAYLPLIGLLLLAAEFEPARRFDLGRRSHVATLAALTLALGTLAAANCRKYRDAETLWSEAVKGSPRSAFAHKQLGVVFYFRQAFGKAEAEYRKALAINPAEPMVHNNLGVLYMNTGKLSAAEEEYLKELTLNPAYDHALFNLGVIYSSTGRQEKAAKLWAKTVRLSPDYHDARQNLAIHYLNRQDYAIAAEQLNEIQMRGGRVREDLRRLLDSRLRASPGRPMASH